MGFFMVDTIVYIYDQAYISGGAAKVAIKSAIALSNRGYRVIYFSALGPVDEELQKSKVETIVIGGAHIGNTKSPVALLKGIWNSDSKKKLDEVLKNLDPTTTVVHVHGWTKSLSASVFDACKKNGIKTYITLHEYFTVCCNGGLYDYNKGQICDLTPGCLKCKLRNCDKKNYIFKIYRNVRQRFTVHSLRKNRPNVIYISKFSRDILKPFVTFANNEYLVENHVDIEKTQKVDAASNSTYLFIGRISGEKAPELFCEAVRKAGVRGVVIGEGPYCEMLKKEYPEIEFTGWLTPNQLETYMLRARCLVITSKWYETMGLTVIEAQGKGIPCIIPDKCAAREYIVDRVDGLLYRVGDIKDLVDKIYKMEDDELCMTFSQSFYDAFNKDRFSMHKHIQELEKVYNDER